MIEGAVVYHPGGGGYYRGGGWMIEGWGGGEMRVASMPYTVKPWH